MHILKNVHCAGCAYKKKNKPAELGKIVMIAICVTQDKEWLTQKMKLNRVGIL